MFGYIRPDLPYLYLKDDKLYKSLYCGICKGIGKTCSQRARLSLTYDVAFLSAVAHNIIGKDVEIKQKRCVAHPIVSRPMASVDDLTETLACVNVLLAYYKIQDDIIDGSGGRFKRTFVTRGYKRAKKKCPEIDNIIKESYNELRKFEKANDSMIDRVCEPFSDMLKKLSFIILGKDFSTEHTENLFYFIGKWIYLIDALDDYDKDIKKKCYNPLRAGFNAESAKQLIENNGKDIAIIFNDIVNNIAVAFNNIKFYFNKDLIGNILLRGIPQKTDEIIKGIIDGKK